MHLFQKNDGRHYNIHRLNKLFAASSVLLLVSVLWLVFDDHGREWKAYQKAFRQLEIEELQARLEPPAPPAVNADAERDRAGQAERDPFADATSGVRDEGAPIADAVPTPSAQDDDPFADAVAGPAGGGDPFAEEAAESAAEAQEADSTRSLSTSEREAVERQLRVLQPGEAGWAHRLAQRIRNLPFIDFADPEYHIDQVVVEGMTENLHFALAPRVDRCITCHQGMLRREFSGAPNPFAAHPNPALYLTSRSPHPLDGFGCISCHEGHGRGTTFVSAAHEPSSEAQRGQWRERHDWLRIEDTQSNMYPRVYVEASCFKCHVGRERLPGAEKLMRGLRLMERAGCQGCHTVPGIEGRPKPGPSLNRLGAKTSRDWIAAWLRDPRAMRPGARMPRFFSEADGDRGLAEIAVITEFLVRRSAADEGLAVHPGDAARGRGLLESTGCLGCHLGPEEAYPEGSSPFENRRGHGPSLADLDAKTSPGWLFGWLKDPRAYDPETRMPNLRLSDAEAADLTAYLLSPRSGARASAAPPLPDLAQALRTIAPMYGKALGQDAPQGQDLASAPIEEQVELFGSHLVRYYGCAGCHAIDGFEAAGTLGPDLTTIGNKTAHELDFGPERAIAHTNYAWLTQKLRDPRSFQRPTAVTPDQRLRMPRYEFSAEEIEALTTALLGFVDTRPSTRLHAHPSPERLAIEAGQRLIRQFNCKGCHLIEDEGGDIRPMVARWLSDAGKAERETADAIAPSFSPPNLIGEGKKVYADWLFRYLSAPTPIRPWLEVRMPTYGFSPAERNTLVTYFSERDGQAVPFADKHRAITAGPLYDAGAKLFSAEYLDCGNCHIQGETLPRGAAERWAPDFALSAERLQPAWVREWLYDPQPLLPGTKMPTYFDPDYFDDAGPDDILDGDEHKQIEALTNYIFTLGAPPGEQTAEEPARDSNGLDDGTALSAASLSN